MASTRGHLHEPVIVVARGAPQVTIVAIGGLLVAKGAFDWSRDSNHGVGYARGLLVVLLIVVAWLAWFRAFRVEVTATSVAFRSLWGHRRWSWDDIQAAYLVSGSPAAEGFGFRPLFRLTLQHVDGTVMDIPYNVCGRAALRPILDRLELDGKLQGNHDES